MTQITTIEANAGSQSRAPDLDWSQVRETMKMINLAVAQLSGTMAHGDESVSELTSSFTTMAQAISEIHNAIGDIQNSENDELLSTIDQKCSTLSDSVQNAIIAFQFYDRLSQNLEHVNENLNSLGSLVCDQNRIYNPSEWTSLQEQIRSGYTMAEERAMFDMMIEGASVEEALSSYKVDKQEREIGEIELF
ncbi:MAG: hypothetical protein AB8D52_00940 [Gammaproteobacteria bacterium]